MVCMSLAVCIVVFFLLMISALSGDWALFTGLIFVGSAPLLWFISSMIDLWYHRRFMKWWFTGFYLIKDLKAMSESGYRYSGVRVSLEEKDLRASMDDPRLAPVIGEKAREFLRLDREIF
ncbi:MAG: hypothetical protein WC641_07630 [Patescibacteria group bacterium]